MQFMKTSKSITGNRTIDIAAMAQHRFDRIQQSNKTNPDFFFDLPSLTLRFFAQLEQVISSEFVEVSFI